MAERDYLDELIERRTAGNPDFPDLLDAASRRRQLLKTMAGERRAKSASQTAVAAAMKSSQSTIARLENSADDAQLSTIDRYLAAIGYRVEYHLVPIGEATDSPVVVRR